jgi:hypothetical protein
MERPNVNDFLTKDKAFVTDEVHDWVMEQEKYIDYLQSQLKAERRNIIGQFIIWMGGEHHFKPKGLEFWIDAFFESITSKIIRITFRGIYF